MPAGTSGRRFEEAKLQTFQDLTKTHLVGPTLRNVDLALKPVAGERERREVLRVDRFLGAADAFMLLHVVTQIVGQPQEAQATHSRCIGLVVRRR